MENSEEAQVGGLSEGEAADDLPTLTVFSNFVKDVVLVSTTNSSLLTCMGEIGEPSKEVIVPFVEMRFEGGATPEDEGVSTEFFSQIVPLENAAFVVSDLAGDFHLVCEHLRKMSTGVVRPEATRLDHARQYLLEAKKSIESSLTEINAIAEMSAHPNKDVP